MPAFKADCKDSDENKKIEFLGKHFLGIRFSISSYRVPNKDLLEKENKNVLCLFFIFFFFFFFFYRQVR